MYLRTSAAIVLNPVSTDAKENSNLSANPLITGSPPRPPLSVLPKSSIRSARPVSMASQFAGEKFPSLSPHNASSTASCTALIAFDTVSAVAPNGLPANTKSPISVALKLNAAAAFAPPFTTSILDKRSSLCSVSWLTEVSSLYQSNAIAASIPRASRTSANST